MIDSLWITKTAGAAIGSSIAVVFKPGGDPILKLIQRFIIGTILGVIFAPGVLYYLGWPQNFENWLSGSALTGLVSYLILQIIFSEKTSEVIRSRIKK